MNDFIKKIRYLGEALIVKLAMGFFALLGEKNASDFGSFLARKIGKLHSSHKLALSNISKAMPHLNEAQKNQIIDDMWDNLGRVVGEYVHLAKLSPQKMVEKYVLFDDKSRANIGFIKQNCKGGIIFSGHIGNWEIGPKTLMSEGFNVSTVYRPLNNPYVEEMTASIRGAKLIAKGSHGGVKLSKQ